MMNSNTNMDKITALLDDWLFAGMKSWDQGSLAERVEILLEMYKSSEEEVARLEAQANTKFEDGYTAGFEDGFTEGERGHSGEM